MNGVLWVLGFLVLLAFLIWVNNKVEVAREKRELAEAQQWVARQSESVTRLIDQPSTKQSAKRQE